jgi:hypothetical protein
VWRCALPKPGLNHRGTPDYFGERIIMTNSAYEHADPTATLPADAPAETVPNTAQRHTGSGFKIAVLISLLGALLIYVLRLDRVFGLFVDDAWYAMLAKALASGQGYTLINSPTAGITPLYPPAFPFLLSLAYRLAPDFPNNIWLLKSVSIAAMMIAGVVAYFYFTRERRLSPYLALGIALATVLNPTLVFLATSTLMSECVFTLSFLLVIVAIERSVSETQGRKFWLLVIAGAVLTAGAFLLRSAAISLVAAAIIYLIKARQWRAAIAFALIVAALCAPWVLYSRSHQPTLAQQQEQGGHIIQPYTQQFWQRRAGDLTSGQITFGDLPARIGANLIEISGRDMLRIFAAPIFERLVDPTREIREQSAQFAGKPRPVWFSFILALIVLIGFVGVVIERITLAEIAMVFTLGVIVLWPWETFRFVLPLTPFWLFYLLAGIKVIGRFFTRRATTPSRSLEWAMGAVVVAMLLISLYAHVNQIMRSDDSSVVRGGSWQNTFEEAERMMSFIKSGLPDNGGIAATNPAFVHLYTNRPTISTGDAAVNIENWRRLGVRYIARVAVFGEDTARPEESGYKVLYNSRTQRGCWLVDLGTPLPPRQ